MTTKGCSVAVIVRSTEWQSQTFEFGEFLFEKVQDLVEKGEEQVVLLGELRDMS